MGKVRYARAARQDLLGLWAQIAERHPSAADRVYDRIESACRVLADHPRLGPARPEIGDGARILVIDRWLALYRLVDGGVQVVRIVDGARDIVRLGWPEPEGGP